MRCCSKDDLSELPILKEESPTDIPYPFGYGLRVYAMLRIKYASASIKS